jgi:hypothetical protein
MLLFGVPDIIVFVGKVPMLVGFIKSS